MGDDSLHRSSTTWVLEYPCSYCSHIVSAHNGLRLFSVNLTYKTMFCFILCLWCQLDYENHGLRRLDRDGRDENRALIDVTGNEYTLLLLSSG